MAQAHTPTFAPAPIRASRTVDLVAERLRQAILDGSFAAGASLPAERQLGTSLGVSRLTLRAALSRLEAEGLVRPRQGDGVLVLDWRASGGLDLLRHMARLDAPLVASFLELRRAVAAEAVALACRRAGRADLAHLRALAAAQASEPDAAAFAERDLAFGRAVLAAAGNLAMQLLLNSVEQVYRAHPALAEALHADRDAVRASYAAVVALIEAGDPAAAREAVRAGLEAIDARALRRLAREARR